MGDWKYITNEVAENTIMKSVKSALNRDEFDILRNSYFWWMERGYWINERLEKTVAKEMARLYPQLQRLYY